MKLRLTALLATTLLLVGVALPASAAKTRLPGAPAALRSSVDSGDTSSAQVEIAWAGVTVNGTSKVTGYRVHRNGTDVTGGHAYTHDIAVSRSNFTFTLLHRATSYTFTVAALTSSGVGPAASVTVTTTDVVNHGPDIICGAPGSINFLSNAGEVVCDGVDYEYLGAWNATATRVTGGLMVTVSAGYGQSVTSGSPGYACVTEDKTISGCSADGSLVFSTDPSTFHVFVPRTSTGSGFHAGLAQLNLTAIREATSPDIQLTIP